MGSEQEYKHGFRIFWTIMHFYLITDSGIFFTANNI